MQLIADVRTAVAQQTMGAYPLWRQPLHENPFPYFNTSSRELADSTLAAAKHPQASIMQWLLAILIASNDGTRDRDKKVERGRQEKGPTTKPKIYIALVYFIIFISIMMAPENSDTRAKND